MSQRTLPKIFVCEYQLSLHPVKLYFNLDSETPSLNFHLTSDQSPSLKFFLGILG